MSSVLGIHQDQRKTQGLKCANKDVYKQTHLGCSGGIGLGLVSMFLFEVSGSIIFSVNSNGLI